MTDATNPNGIPPGSQPTRGRLLYWRCPDRCGRAIRWDKTVEPPVARCGCGQSSDLERVKVDRAMAALDTMATVWAAQFNLRQAVQAMMTLPDGEERLIALVKQAHCEGLYAGRMSHRDHPSPSHQHPDGSAPT